MPKKAWAEQAPKDGAKAQNWLTLTDEPALEPGLPIIDPHHHLWDRPSDRYLLEELVADARAHNVRQTVFVECTSMYRAEGPDEFKVIGETEFVQGIAARSASGRYGETRVAAGIVGTADLRLGDRIAPVLEAQIAASPQRFRGIRHRAAWVDRSVVPNQPADLPQHVLLDASFRRGYDYLRQYGLSFEGVGLSHPHRRPHRPRPGPIRRSSSTISADRSVSDHTRDVATRCSPHGSQRSLSWRKPERGREGGRHPDGGQWLRLARAQAAANVGRAAGGQREVVPLHD